MLKRKTIKILPLMIILGIFLIGCNNVEEKLEDNYIKQDTLELSEIKDALNQSGFEIIKQMTQKDYSGKNLMISPVSLFTAISMTANGASNDVLEEMRKYMLFVNDFTEEELREFNQYLISLLNRKENGLELSLANSVWIYDEKEDMIKESFKELLEEIYNSELKTFNESKDYEKINFWIEKHTNQRIKDMLSQGDLEPIEEQLMLLVNALYFRGTWENRFVDRGILNDKTFKTNEGEVRPNWLYNESRYQYIKDDELTAVILPYALKNEDGTIGKRSGVSMQILMPKEKNLDEFIKSLSSDVWNDFQEKYQTPTRGANIQLYMPKFRYESPSISMKDYYKDLGAQLPFEDEDGALMWNRMVNEDADLISIEDILHKTFIEVDEHGTEAAAATVVIMRQLKATAIEPTHPIKITFDRPFVYVITDDETGTILFLGKVEDPTNEN